MTDRVSIVLKSRGSPDMLPFSLCNNRRLAIRHMNRHLFPTTLLTIDSVLRNREVVRAKNLPVPPRKAFIDAKIRRTLQEPEFQNKESYASHDKERVAYSDQRLSHSVTYSTKLSTYTSANFSPLKVKCLIKHEALGRVELCILYLGTRWK